jgi:hypothetical protein
MTFRFTAALATGLLVAITAAGCSDASPSPVDPSTSSATATATGSGGGTTSSATTGSAGNGGSGGGIPEDCDGIRDAIVDFLGAHSSCGQANDCTRPILPDNSLAFCDPVAALGGDAAALDALVDAWNAKGCSEPGTCGFIAGTAECVAGQCVLVEDTSCDDCSAELDPQCTVNGSNALNACFAESCLHEAVAHPGFCADSPECTAASGTCEETFFDQPPCPDGTRWDLDDPEESCPGGNLRNTCCQPWDAQCSFVATSMTLSLDPFTCAAPDGNDGQPWMCAHIPAQDDCSVPATMEQPLGDTWNASVTVDAAFGNMVTVTGTHADTGRTFTCTGKVSYDTFDAQSWSCTSCAPGAVDCIDCIVLQQGGCNL